MKKADIILVLLMAIPFVNFGQTNEFPLPIGDVIIRGDNAADESQGIKWLKNSLHYGIYRTAGGWNAPNYQQLQINWATGIILNPAATDGFKYGKSFVEIQGDGLRVSSGNVGIGTISPSEKLEVNGLIKIPEAKNQDNDSPGITWVGNDDFLHDGQYLNHYGFGFHTFNDGSAASVGQLTPINTYVSGYFGVDFFSGGANRMRISTDGIVSIGSVIRQVGYKLAVNGNIKAKEIKVETGWSDFVFEKEYALPTLQEVETQIKSNGHLKDIPSAKEVEENGILLGEMNAKLLQKIEELTLYAIEQEKQLDEQKQKNTNLEARLQKIEQLLSNGQK